GVRGLMKTEEVLKFVMEVMPELTLYIDARNDSPISVIEFLKKYPNFRDRIVIKVYPFTLGEGAYGLVKKYAKRNGVSESQAEIDIKNINPNFLLALGGVAAQVNESVFSRAYSNYWWSDFKSHLNWYPFSSVKGEVRFRNELVFSQADLRRIDAKT